MSTQTQIDGPYLLRWSAIGKLISSGGLGCVTDGKVDLLALCAAHVARGNSPASRWVIVSASLSPEGYTYSWERPVPVEPSHTPPLVTRTAGDHGLCHYCSRPLAIETPDFMCPSCKRAEHGREREQHCQDAGEYAKGL